jgi:hypothetical protein
MNIIYYKKNTGFFRSSGAQISSNVAHLGQWLKKIGLDPDSAEELEEAIKPIKQAAALLQVLRLKCSVIVLVKF